MTTAALVVGLGVSGDAAVRRLLHLGYRVTACDDRPTVESTVRADALGVELAQRPDDHDLDRLVSGADLVVVSPGVPMGHAVFGMAAHHDVPVWSEVELAARAIDLPLVAVTGTNGKTTVTTLVAEMLDASGIRAVATGNLGPPLSDAIGCDADVVVVEVSSFQLRHSPTFRPRVGVWLNLAEDHLDWHSDLRSYAAAKARIWANQGGSDVAIANAEDPEVMHWAAQAPVPRLTFGVDAGDCRVSGGVLRAVSGEEIVAVSDLPRSHTHDLANAAAASAAAIAAGATTAAAGSVLRRFEGLPHRLTLVGDAGGVRWYDDSKATNPHAALTAVRGFDSVVLVAGGRNKGLDLSPLASESARLRAVVAIGEAAPEVAAAFSGSVDVVTASSMDEAVGAAGRLARPGDSVLLSPACASFDWYRHYGERGDDFARAVRSLHLRAL